MQLKVKTSWWCLVGFLGLLGALPGQTAARKATPMITIEERLPMGGNGEPELKLLGPSADGGCRYQVSIGSRPTGGYSIKDVTLKEKELIVQVDRPPAGAMVIQMLSHPVAIIKANPCFKDLPKLIIK